MYRGTDVCWSMGLAVGMMEYEPGNRYGMLPWSVELVQGKHKRGRRDDLFWIEYLQTFPFHLQFHSREYCSVLALMAI